MSHRPVVVFIDPGPLAGDIPGEVLDAVLRETTVLSLNVREVGLLGGDVGALLGRCARGAVVLERDGARGCTLWWTAGLAVRSAHLPAPSVRAADSTGAGDAHAGAFLAALADPALARDLASGLAPPATLDASPEVVRVADAVRVANAAAAYAVTMVGSAAGPTRSQLRAFLAERPRGRT
jgi:sugar/nucleoside kinase (ribokinase family)